jgi:uncharacterized LabA/DUF88 family protein
MSPMYGGTPPSAEYLYVDGGYLRKRLETYSQRYFNGEPFELDFANLFGAYEKKFYYDCLPSRRKDEEENALKEREDKVREFFDSLKVLPGFHVYEGRVSGEGERARQKGVDIQLAVHMLSQASRGTVRKITLLAGDADFQPLADAVVAEGAYLTLWADRRSASRSLVHAVDVFRPLEITQLFNAITAAFKHKHALPQLSGELKANSEGLPMVRSGSLQCGGAVGLFSDGTRSILIYPSGTTHHLHIRWHRPDAVVKIAEDLGEKIIWDGEG